MSTGHCFISYSNRDAENFGPQLSLELEGEHPFFETWYDKKNIPPGQKWDSVISKAIRDCKCFLFVVTSDGVIEDSICMRELSLALSYKKPIFPLCLQTDVELPWRIRDFQRIDFYENQRKGMAQLRLAIQRIDSPEGQLDALKDRLSAAERDLNNAKGEEEKLRAQIDAEDLTRQIQVQERIVANPKAAEEQTQANIAAGLERERESKESAAKKTHTKFINPPPGIAPNYFQDRTTETGEIVRFLHDDAQRMMTIVGRGGVGKTAMVCRLLKHLENSTLPEDITKTFPQTKVDGIIYLSESGSHRVNFANIFYDLCKLLPSDAAQELDAVYKNPQGSTESKMRALLEKFGDERVVLLLDNFEPLVDTETFAIRDTELDEALRVFLNGTHTAVKVVITTRVAPQILNRKVQPGRQRILDLHAGLEQKYATKMLREMDADGKLGLKKAKAELLKLTRKRTLGYPRALEALFAILASDRYTTLEEILARAENYLPDEVVEALVGEAFNRLDTKAQKVMQALAVYNRPVTPAAMDYLLALHIPAIDSAPILQRLANMHFARKEGGRFYLHPVDREFAFGLIPLEDLPPTSEKLGQTDTTVIKEQPKVEKSASEIDNILSELRKRQNSFPRISQFDKFTKHHLTLRAADYFRQARKPRAEWKNLDDLTAQLAEFELRCDADDYETAAQVLTDIDGDYLFLWGHYRLLIDLREKLQGNLTDPFLGMLNLGSLGSANAFIGRVQDAIIYQEQALSVARRSKDRRNESGLLCNLGNRYYVLGNIDKAIEFYEQASTIAREIGDREYEGSALGDLGNCYLVLGEIRKAIEFYEQALVIRREIGDKYGEANDLDNTGLALLNLEDYQEAKNIFSQAFQIADEISYPVVQIEARWGLAQAYLFQNDLVNACAIIEAALPYDEPTNNHNATALHGIIALRQGEKDTAQEAFTKSIAQADEILAKTPDFYEALDAKGLALCGRVVSGEWKVGSERERDEILAEAVKIFKRAREIAPHAGVVKSVLRLFDELVKCDEAGILKDVRDAVEGK